MCAACAQSAATGSAVASALGVNHRLEGLVAAGTPLGSNAFVKSVARSRDETVAAYASLPLCRQEKFLLLCSSLQARLTQLTRIFPWSRLSHHVAAAELQVLLTALDLVKHPLPAAMWSDPVVALLTLPLRSGGLTCGSAPMRPALPTWLCGPRRPPFGPSTPQAPTSLPSSLGGRRFTMRHLASGPWSFGRLTRPYLPRTSCTLSGSMAATSRTC
jgi:hypothetical protein